MNDRVRVGETGQQTPIPRLSRPSPAPELAESPDLDESGRCAGVKVGKRTSTMGRTAWR